MLVQHLLNLKDSATGSPIEDPSLPSMIDNWVRLGLVDVHYDKHLIDESHYTWVEQRPEYIRLTQESRPNESTINFQKGIMQRTELGKRFAKATGIQ